ncbi:hypothetical protein PCANC_10085 [Puccinia coronata f. sp. avenae]|uniref:Uncharacterized protein n=1 Tax=Puccinia coronata f. sp. avenae TaxID=200324 RepID=A0A2N5V796_9BASI|nr:hypothetical protein PCANC_10085 [Puccinia coronata f. sp. avenae]
MLSSNSQQPCSKPIRKAQIFISEQPHPNLTQVLGAAALCGGEAALPQGGTCELCHFFWWDRNPLWQEENFIAVLLLPHLIPQAAPEPQDRS